MLEVRKKNVRTTLYPALVAYLLFSVQEGRIKFAST